MLAEATRALGIYCISAGMARGIPLPDIMQTAGQFLELAIKDTVADGIPRNDGVNYEKYLSCLIPECNNFLIIRKDDEL